MQIKEYNPQRPTRRYQKEELETDRYINRI